jgi:hypothetical protein
LGGEYHENIRQIRIRCGDENQTEKTELAEGLEQEQVEVPDDPSGSRLADPVLLQADVRPGHCIQGLQDYQGN